VAPSREKENQSRERLLIGPQVKLENIDGNRIFVRLKAGSVINMVGRCVLVAHVAVLGMESALEFGSFFNT